MVRFARDLGAARYRRRVQQDAESGQASGVTGAPTFFVDGWRHTGPTDAGTLAAALLGEAGHGGHGVGDPEVDGRTGGLPPVDVPHDGDAVDDDISQALTSLPEEAPETLDRGGDHSRLDDTQLARLEQPGTRRTVARGDVLYRPGDPSYDLVVVLSATVAGIATSRAAPLSSGSTDPDGFWASSTSSTTSPSPARPRSSAPDRCSWSPSSS